MKNKDLRQAMVSWDNIVKELVEDSTIDVTEFKLLCDYSKTIITMKECEVKCVSFI